MVPHGLVPVPAAKVVKSMPDDAEIYMFPTEILGVVENMAMHVCSQCGHQEHIFGDAGGERIAADYGVPLLGSLPLDRSIREQTDAGNPTVMADPASPAAVIYREMADKLAATLAGRSDDVVQQFPEVKISDD